MWVRDCHSIIQGFRHRDTSTLESVVNKLGQQAREDIQKGWLTSRMVPFVCRAKEQKSVWVFSVYRSSANLEAHSQRCPCIHLDVNARMRPVVNVRGTGWPWPTYRIGRDTATLPSFCDFSNMR